jgi:hypothetical protein
MTTNRCTGHCCRAFYLPLSPADLRAGCERRKVLLFLVVFFGIGAIEVCVEGPGAPVLVRAEKPR